MASYRGCVVPPSPVLLAGALAAGALAARCACTVTGARLGRLGRRLGGQAQVGGLHDRRRGEREPAVRRDRRRDRDRPHAGWRCARTDGAGRERRRLAGPEGRRLGQARARQGQRDRASRSSSSPVARCTRRSSAARSASPRATSSPRGRASRITAPSSRSRGSRASRGWCASAPSGRRRAATRAPRSRRQCKGRAAKVEAELIDAGCAPDPNPVGARGPECHALRQTAAKLSRCSTLPFDLATSLAHDANQLASAVAGADSDTSLRVVERQCREMRAQITESAQQAGCAM